MNNINEIKDKLIAIAGPGNVLTEKEQLVDYSHDETMGLQSFPDMVVKVENTYQVAEVLKLANRFNFPVIPRGAGTGLSGRAQQRRGGPEPGENEPDTGDR
jgi:glycolate oxidase